MHSLEDKDTSKSSPSAEKLQKNLDAIDVLLQGVAEKHQISINEIIEFLKNKSIKHENGSILVPCCIFRSKSLGILESTVKYLKEEHRLAYHKIAKILQRDGRVIWVTYNKAFRKNMERFEIASPNYWVPVLVFTNKILGPLESLTKYLIEDEKLNLNQIANLLNRDSKSIWLCYKRAKEKENGHQIKA